MPEQPTPDGYHGRILSGSYSRGLKRRILECIRHFQVFDELGTPAIPYIAAWHEQNHVISACNIAYDALPGKDLAVIWKTTHRCKKQIEIRQR